MTTPSTPPTSPTDPQKSAGVYSDKRPDHIDKMVFSATHAVRKDYIEACRVLGIRPRDLTPPVIGMRSVTP